MFFFYPYPLFPRIPLHTQLFIDMMLMFGTISYFDLGFGVCMGVCACVCLCVFASDIYVDTSQGKKRVCSIQFFLFGLKIAWEKKQKQHTLLWGAHARIHKIIALSLMLFQFVLCYFFILDLFHSFFSSLDKIDLNVMLSYMLLFTCYFFYSSNRYTYLLCYIFFAH